MTIQADDPELKKRLLAERQLSGADRFDEVWDGVYVMAPLADIEHQETAGDLGAVIRVALGWDDAAKVYVGVNVSDQDRTWRKNYRCPDVAVYLAGNPAVVRRNHWFGGPDFAVEILSPKDRSRKKLEFYAKVGVRELLLVNRKPWQLELYRLHDGKLCLAGKSDVKQSTRLVSSVLPVVFRLIAGKERPRIEVVHQQRDERWLV